MASPVELTITQEGNEYADREYDYKITADAAQCYGECVPETAALDLSTINFI
jgi:hypothetical protein